MTGERDAGPHAGVAEARGRLEAADRVLVLTGAGISAESGVPTFRGEAGLWRRHRPEELATPRAFARDPRLVWEWYGWRRELVAACSPNAAHRAIADWQARSPAAVIATQNVDGLHGLADVEAGRPGEGGPARGGRLLEIHGTLFGIRCTRCLFRAEHRDPIDAGGPATLPRCPECGGPARPDVVWFGEPLDPAVLERAFSWAEAADVCLVIGTSGVVQPAAGLATITRETGGTIIEVNPDVTPLTREAAVSIRGTAGAIVPRIVPGAGAG